MILFLFLLFEEFVEVTCFDNNSVTGRIDKDAPVGNVGVGGVGGVSAILLFLEVEVGGATL